MHGMRIYPLQAAGVSSHGSTTNSAVADAAPVSSIEYVIPARPRYTLFEDSSSPVGRLLSTLLRLDMWPFLLLHAVALHHYATSGPLDDADTPASALDGWDESGPPPPPHLQGSILSTLFLITSLTLHALARLLQVWIPSCAHVYNNSDCDVPRARSLFVKGRGSHADGSAALSHAPARDSDCVSCTEEVQVELPGSWSRPYRHVFTHGGVSYALLTTSTGEWAFTPVSPPDALPIASYLNWARGGGWTSTASASVARVWGENSVSVPLPSLAELVVQQCTAPFFLLQLLCVALWACDDYAMYSLFTLSMLLLMEGMMIFQRFKLQQALRGMRPQPRSHYVLRGGTWTLLPSKAILPGDVISLAAQPEPSAGEEEGCVVPVDALLLQGSVVVNEATLTGESTPCVKEALDGACGDDVTQPLDAFTPASTRTHARNCVYGGTSILSASGGGAWGTLDPAPDAGVLALVIRTGGCASAGQVMRTLTHASTQTHTRENTVHAFIFIAVLLTFAIASASYLIAHTWYDPTRSRTRVTIHAIMILTSVVPADLPVQMQLAVNSSVTTLMRVGVYVLEPARIPLAGRVNVCAFDKTGTLTRDTFRVNGIAMCRPAGSSAPPPLHSITVAPFNSVCVLVGCQELTLVSKQVRVAVTSTPGSGGPAPAPAPPPAAPPRTLSEAWAQAQEQARAQAAARANIPVFETKTVREYVGDPLERACMTAVEWSAVEGARALPAYVRSRWAPNGTHNHPDKYVDIIRVFPFTSSLKRMTTIVRVHAPDAPSNLALRVCVKGAPETVAGMLAHVPDGYYETVEALTLTGARVLALAMRLCGESDTPATARTWSQATAETGGFTFCGFLTLTQPLKTDTKRLMSRLRQSGRRCICITGDHPLTAVAVTHEAGMLPRLGHATQSVWILHEGACPNSDAPPIAAPADISLYWQVVTLSRSQTGHTCEYRTADISCIATRAQPSASSAHICITAAALRALSRSSHPAAAAAAACMLTHGRIFARFSPDMKARVVTHAIAAGNCVSMCGDGTNDVGALTAAQVGVSILSNPRLEAAYDHMRLRSRAAAAAAAKPGAAAVAAVDTDDELESLISQENAARTRTAAAPTPAANGGGAANGDVLSAMQARMRELEAETGGALGATTVALGDASAASPFTARVPTPACVQDILRAGVCTLVVTHQMYAILAVSSLVSAYTLSSLYIHGVRSGDTQATVGSIASAVAFMALSYAKPSKRLAVGRPEPHVFNLHFGVCIVVTAVVHLACIATAVHLCSPYTAQDTAASIEATRLARLEAANMKAAEAAAAAAESGDDPAVALARLTARDITAGVAFEFVDDRVFAPNHINTCVYLVSSSANAITFLVMYAGAPHMTAMKDNLTLLRTSVGIILTCLALAAGVSDDLSDYLQCVHLPRELGMAVCGLILLDALLCVGIRYAFPYMYTPAEPKVELDADEALEDVPVDAPGQALD